MAKISLRDFGVELIPFLDDSAASKADMLVGNIQGLKNKPAYTKAIGTASSRFKVDVEFGKKWVIVEGTRSTNQNETYLPK